jgi:hypothetical protein
MTVHNSAWYRQLNAGIDAKMEADGTVGNKRAHWVATAEALEAIKDEDPEVGALLMQLRAASTEELRLRGIGHFLWVMRHRNNPRLARVSACGAADLLPEPSDEGLADKLISRMQRSAREPGKGRVVRAMRRLTEPRD